MKKLNTRYNDVKPSELKKGDRIHTAAGLFQIVKLYPLNEKKKNYLGLELRSVFSQSRKKVYLAVHKSTRFTINRPNKK